MGLYPDEQMLDLLPQWYRQILDYQAICGAEQKEFDRLGVSTGLTLDNFFPQSLTEEGLGQWEQALGIWADPQTETIEFRRARILNRLSTKPPFTLNFLRKKLDELIGPGKWEIYMDYPGYTLYVESSAKNQSYAVEVSYTVGRIKPAHIVYINAPFVSARLELTEETTATKTSYNYKLGTWMLGQGPIGTVIRSEVVKMADIASLQEELLSRVAGYTSGEIVSARINGETVITALSHTVAGNVVTISYTVSAQQAAEITLVELLDKDGAVLCRDQIYVPVDGSIQMRHRIITQEGGN